MEQPNEMFTQDYYELRHAALNVPTATGVQKTATIIVYLFVTAIVAFNIGVL